MIEARWLTRVIPVPARCPGVSQLGILVRILRAISFAPASGTLAFEISHLLSDSCGTLPYRPGMGYAYKFVTQHDSLVITGLSVVEVVVSCAGSEAK